MSISRLVICCFFVGVADLRAEVSFRQEVMPILARGGCNSGACHGNLNGKGGFKLSLRGEDPESDYLTLTREMLGRRLDPLRPAESLLLRKATGAVPHEGGVRYHGNTPEALALEKWIAQGMPRDAKTLPTLRQLHVTPTDAVHFDPSDRFQMRIEGTFSDGSRRDLSGLAVYEVTEPGYVQITPQAEVIREQFGHVVVLVRYLDQQVPVTVAFLPNRPSAWTPPVPLNNVDPLIFARLRDLRLPPSELAPDAMFLRRIYLDLLGLLPTPAEVRSFLRDPARDKRERLIDALLQRPEFADFWSQKWADILRNEEKSLDRKGTAVYHQWLRQAIAGGMPLNELARELISSRGSTYEQPAANLYRSLRDPLSRAESVAQIFLGVRIGCAKCHNHPFDRWTQDEYHRFAALFSQVQYRVRENNKRDKLDSHEFDGEQIVYIDRSAQWPHPLTGKAAVPKFLGSDSPLSPGEDRLQQLADWVAAPGNRLFARAQANRVWFHLMGRGLVEPNDDFRLNNPPTHPELLDHLADELVAHDYDLRHLIRTITRSRTYQLTSTPTAINQEDELNWSHAMVRPIQAEPLIDSLSQVLGRPIEFTGYPKGTRATQLDATPQGRRGAQADEAIRFLKVFGRPDRLLTCECERSDDPGLIQAFQFVTGELVMSQLRHPDNRLGRMLGKGHSDAEILDTFYLSALSRLPSERERVALLQHVTQSKDRRAGWEDVVWGIINAKEFLLRR